jgi:outer membrane autotransporter protein
VVIQGVGRVLDLGFNGSITGGDGGAGGTTALGGNGGAGVVSDAFTTITIDGTVKGGNGQGAGSGGAGLDLRHGGTVRNFGDIVGGDGGAGAVAVPPGVVAGGTGSGGAPGMRPEFVGSSQGGAGVVGANLTISTGGLIAGGSSAFGQANAISFIGGDNRLELLGGYTFIGNVVVDTAAGATGTLVLDSPSSLSSDNFDVDAFGTTFQGFTAVEKTGGGQWDLTSSSGTGSLSGPVAVKGGRLRAQADNVFGSTSAFTLTGVGVLDASDFDNTIGSLAGTGGGLQIGNGTISVGADNTSTEFAGEIFNLTPGLGTFRKIGVGTLTLTGNSSSFTGTANVVGGKLVVGVGGAGQLGGTLLVENGGALGGTGSVGATTIFAGGTHAPGNSIGTQTVNGNYINSGVLEIEAGPTSADQIIVNGTVDITGATLDLLLSPGAVSNWGGPFIVIANDGGDAVIGAFDPVTENLLFLDPSLDYAGGDGNDVSLDLVRNNVQFADVAKTANQRAVAGSIDTMSGGPIVGSLISQTDADLVRASYDALSGEIHASLQSGLINNGLMLGNAADSRLRAAFDFAGADAAPVLAYGRDGTRLALPNTNLAAAWGTAYGAWGTIESDGNAASLDTSSGGLVAGIDGRLGGWRLGFLASYGQSDFSADARSSSADSDNYAFGLYGGTKWGNLAFRSGLTASWHDIDTDRTVTLPGLTDQPSASYDANTILAFGELGYRLELTNTAMIGPFANFTHVHLSTDDFTETGGFAALTGSEASTDTSFTTIGLRASNQFAMGAMLGTVHAMAGWRHGFGDLTPTSSLAFVAGGDAFAISGVSLAENTALLQAGIDLSLSETSTFGINYDGRFAKETNVNAVSANLTVAF